jgi:predicted CopG family antitoxin
VLTFFGLNDEYIENVYEQLFQLKYHGGWSFFETYNLPVSVRVWFLERLIKQKKDESEQVSRSTQTAGRGRTYKP